MTIHFKNITGGIKMNISDVKDLVLGNITENHVYKGCGETVKGDLFISADGVQLLNLTVEGNVTVSGAKYFVMKNCTVKGSVTLDKAVNGLIAQSFADCISVNGSYNCAVILNKANFITVEGNKDVYAVDNTVNGILSFKNNDRVIADGNSFSSIENISNVRENGDSLTDVNERVEFGACEKLLPHTDKDLFVGMERLDVVKGTGKNVYDFLRDEAANNDVAILAPGAYSTKTIYMDAEHSGTTLYAYGAMIEITDYTTVIKFDHVDNFTVKGLTVGYSQQSAYQLHVIDKDGEKREVTVVCAAGYTLQPAEGMSEKFLTNDNIKYGFCIHTDIYPWGLFYTQWVRRNEDGTITFGALDDPEEKYSKFSMLRKGDAFHARICNPLSGSMITAACSNFTYKDVVIYGASSNCAFVEHSNRSSVHYYRCHDTTRAPFVIDKETYDYYKLLEEKHDVDLEVYVDELGRYRGSTPRISSIDATHVMCCEEGITATSCLFEYMCDDGSNHRASSARLHAVRDNGDGTTTLEFKNNLAEVYAKNYGGTVGSFCPKFCKGDILYSYTSKGQILCDTHVLDDEKEIGKGINEHTNGEYTIKSVKVATDALCLKVLDGYDLSDNHYRLDNKVFIDNTSHNSQGFHFDNVKVQGIRSRGFMVKAPNGVIEHCTYRDLAMAAIACKAEVDWSESTIAKNIRISNCLFDNAGRWNNRPDVKMYGSIIIESLCKYIGPNSLVHDNIVIHHNKIMNSQNQRAIYVNSVQNVKITENVFCGRENETEDDLGTAVEIDTALNVEISGNTYSPLTKNNLDVIKVTNACGIYGKDVEDENGNSLIPDSVSEYEPD